MYIAAVRISDNKLVGVQQSPTKPADTGTTTFIQISEADYSLISDLSHPAGGDLKWSWNGTIFVVIPDPRRKLRVTVASSTVASGTAAQITISVLKADGTIDTAFNGQILVLVQAGGENQRIFRVQFALGIKVVNVATGTLNRTLELLSSPLSLMEASVPITIVQDV